MRKLPRKQWGGKFVYFAICTLEIEDLSFHPWGEKMFLAVMRLGALTARTFSSE